MQPSNQNLAELETHAQKNMSFSGDSECMNNTEKEDMQ